MSFGIAVCVMICVLRALDVLRAWVCRRYPVHEDFCDCECHDEREDLQ